MEDFDHVLASKYKELYHELGRCPKITELQESIKGLPGIWNHLVKIGINGAARLAGIEHATGSVKNKPKERPSIFYKDLEYHFEQYEPRKLSEKVKLEKILVLGDTHWPYASIKALEEVYRFAEINQPKHIVQMGDSVDFYSHSKFPRSHNEFTPKQEEQMARDGLSKMWDRLHKICPDAYKYMLIGNHCLRPLKRLQENVPAMEHWVEKYFEDYFTFDNVKTVFDSREPLIICDIVFTHGFLGSEGKHRDYFLKNTVIGHLHKGWVQYRRFHNDIYWELCAGFLGEPESKGLTYNNSKMANYQLGFGWIDEWGPRFIHL